MNDIDVSSLVGKASRPELIRSFLPKTILDGWSSEMLVSELGSREIPVEFSLQELYHPKPNINGGKYRKKSMPLSEALALVSFGSKLSCNFYCSEILMNYYVPELFSFLPRLSASGGREPYHQVLFIGNTNTGSHVHYDLPDNVICILKGTKRFQLFHPSFSNQLKPHTLPFSCCNISSLTDSEVVSVFDNQSGDYCLDFVARAGDAVYIPSGWWHRVTNEGLTMSVSSLWPPHFLRQASWGYMRVKLARTRISKIMAKAFLKVGYS